MSRTRCTILVVKARYGFVRHAITEGAECQNETLCGRRSNGWLFCDDNEEADCKRCVVEIERLGWN